LCTSGRRLCLSSTFIRSRRSQTTASAWSALAGLSLPMHPPTHTVWLTEYCGGVFPDCGATGPCMHVRACVHVCVFVCVVGRYVIALNTDSRVFGGDEHVAAGTDYFTQPGDHDGRPCSLQARTPTHPSTRTNTHTHTHMHRCRCPYGPKCDKDTLGGRMRRCTFRRGRRWCCGWPECVCGKRVRLSVVLSVSVSVSVCVVHGRRTSTKRGETDQGDQKKTGARNGQRKRAALPTPCVQA
jgi:hypothetical protein